MTKRILGAPWRLAKIRSATANSVSAGSAAVSKSVRTGQKSGIINGLRTI